MNRQLPRLANDPGKGLPRVYVLAAEIVMDCAASLDSGHIRSAVETFQTVSPLNHGGVVGRYPLCCRISLLELLAQGNCKK